MEMGLDFCIFFILYVKIASISMTCLFQTILFVWFLVHLKRLKGIQWNFLGSKISTFSTKFVFLGPIRKQDGHPGLWLAETFWTSPLKLLNRIWQNLTGSKISKSSTKFVFFRADRKNKMTALASDWLRHSTSPLKPLNRIQRYLTGRKVFYQVCRFGTICKTRLLPWPLIGWDIFDVE